MSEVFHYLLPDEIDELETDEFDSSTIEDDELGDQLSSDD